jgi:hypothetical protein
MEYTAKVIDNYSAIDVTPMPNMENRYGVLRIIDFVYDAIIPHADAPPCTTRQSKTPRGSRIMR